MGAALTYARRYALFTLVGIAGEDDLDAPDVATPTNRTSGPEKPTARDNARLNGGHSGSVRRRSTPVLSTASLEPAASVVLRDRLLAELTGLSSGDDMAVWAHRCLPEKNRLSATDAERMEEAFQAKLNILAVGAADASQAQGAAAYDRNTRQPGRQSVRRHSRPIDKGLLALPEPRRVRDRDHVRAVAKRPCLICGRRPSDAHHLRFAQSRALGRKVSDEFTVPLCRGHHREVHRCGDEAGWWRRAGIDPSVAARALWVETHPRNAGYKQETVGII